MSLECLAETVCFNSTRPTIRPLERSTKAIQLSSRLQKFDKLQWKIKLYTSVVKVNDLRVQNLGFIKVEDTQLVSNTKLQEGRLRLILYI